MSRGTSLVGASVAASCDDGVQCSDTVDGAVSDADAGDTAADTIIVHDEVQAEVLDEEGAVVGEGTTEEGVQHGVTCSVGHCTSTICLF